MRFRHLLAKAIDCDVAGKDALTTPKRRILRFNLMDSQAYEQHEAESAWQRVLRVTIAATSHLYLGPRCTDLPTGGLEPTNST